LIYVAAVFIDSAIQNRSPKVGLLSVYSTFIMLIGYGTGMIRALFRRYLLGSGKESEKPEITREA
jgi:hypothetical protein